MTETLQTHIKKREVAEIKGNKIIIHFIFSLFSSLSGITDPNWMPRASPMYTGHIQKKQTLNETFESHVSVSDNDKDIPARS